MLPVKEAGERESKQIQARRRLDSAYLRPLSPIHGELHLSRDGFGNATWARWDSESVRSQVQHLPVTCSAQH